MSKQWYAVYTKPRQEVRAEQNLHNQNFRVYLPRLLVEHQRGGKRVDVIEPMFPRYLFVELAIHEDNIAPIRSTCGVANIVRFTESPAVVPRHFVESLQQSEDEGKSYHSGAQNVFLAGSGVDVVAGPLAGLQAVVKCDKGDERVVLMLSMLGRENETLVPRHQLVPS